MTSIFDSIQQPEDYKLWTKVTKKIQEQEVLISGLVGKKSVKASRIEKRIFYLTKTHLYYRRRGGEGAKLGKAMDLSWVRLSHEVEPIQLDEANGFRFCFKLVKNMKYTMLYFEEEDKFKNWLNILRQIAVLTDFHQVYKVHEKLGSGSFAKVSTKITF